MNFKVYRTNTFEKDFTKLSKNDQDKIVNFEKKLAENPFTGKPLSYMFLREKKFDDKRVYYLIYEDLIVVLMVAISDKKAQQATIDAIKERLEEYKDLIRETLKKI